MRERLQSLICWGEELQNLPQSTVDEWFDLASQKNPWFDRPNLERALAGVLHYLSADQLRRWCAAYTWPEKQNPRKIGVVMAGNIPMVGFHDLLSVLVSGHILYAKLSQKDEVLLPKLIQVLIEIDPYWSDYLNFVPQLKGMDAYIATGSDNSARYFKYYFGDRPHVIRKNRTACAVLDGHETDQELLALGEDVFAYYGLGCRNVSKLWLPEGYDMVHLLDVWQAFATVNHHHKYSNNYIYQQGIRLMNQEPIYDSGFLVLLESEEFFAPTAMLYYSFYKNLNDVEAQISARAEDIQCVVSREGTFLRGVGFGQAQHPNLWDYADGVDTLNFLLCDTLG